MDRVVFWDFDGTLAVRDGMWSGCLLECLAEATGGPVTLTVADVRPWFSGGFPWHEPETGHEHLADPDAWWEHLEGIFRRALVNLGADPAAARLMRHRYTDPARWTLAPDAVESLAELRAAGWRNVILSNHVPELARLVDDLGIPVEAVLSSANVGWEKPNPRFFRYALDHVGRPRHAWMVGDNPVADVQGAQAAGISAILVEPGGLRGAVRSILD